MVWKAYCPFLFLLSLNLLSQAKIIGLATNTEEYVPTTTPIIRAKAKSCMTPPPRTNNANTTTSVVVDVRIVLLRVSLMLAFMTSSKLRLRKRLRFSLILSKTTMVSFREYPTMVRNAATIEREISRSVSAKAPTVIVTSWIRARMAPIAYLSLRNQHRHRVTSRAIRINQVTLTPRLDAK